MFFDNSDSDDENYRAYKRSQQSKKPISPSHKMAQREKLEKNLTNIADLKIFTRCPWTIKGNVTYKSHVAALKSAQKQMFHFEVMDDTGDIKITAFGHMANKYFPLIVEGNVYYFSNLQVKARYPSCNKTSHKYELVITNNSNIIWDMDLVLTQGQGTSRGTRPLDDVFNLTRLQYRANREEVAGSSKENQNPQRNTGKQVQDVKDRPIVGEDVSYDNAVNSFTNQAGRMSSCYLVFSSSKAKFVVGKLKEEEVDRLFTMFPPDETESVKPSDESIDSEEKKLATRTEENDMEMNPAKKMKMDSTLEEKCTLKIRSVDELNSISDPKTNEEAQSSSDGDKQEEKAEVEKENEDPGNKTFINWLLP